MAVYIDQMNAKFGRMIMCHMMADTTDELIQMAKNIGVNTKWIQDKGTPHEHFDISLGKKKIAIEKFGAIEVGWREIANLIKRRNNVQDKINNWKKRNGKR